jgi:hypothetical protein
MSPNDPDTSPELGLLERLATSDLSLTAAIELFPRIDRAKKAVEVCVRSQAVELICKSDGAETAVQPWRLRFVLNDPGTWESQASNYYLQLTAEARERFTTDGRAFVEDLFQHQLFQT